MPDIGIIGGGVGGTRLGLFLRQHGVSATIYSAKTPAQHLAARITNVVCHHHGPGHRAGRQQGVPCRICRRRSDLRVIRVR